MGTVTLLCEGTALGWSTVTSWKSCFRKYSTCLGTVHVMHFVYLWKKQAYTCLLSERLEEAGAAAVKP